MQEDVIGYTPFMTGDERIMKALAATYGTVGMPCFETRADAKAYGIRMLDELEQAAEFAGFKPPTGVNIKVSQVFRAVMPK